MLRAISFGVFLSRSALDKADHSVEKTVARIGSDSDQNPVADHTCSAGDRTPVSAAFANHGRRFAGNRRLIDTRNSLDDFAVARN